MLGTATKFKGKQKFIYVMYILYTTFIKHCNRKFDCNNYCAHYYCTQDGKEMQKSVMYMRRAVGH